MEGYPGRPATHHFGEYGPKPHPRIFRHQNVDETPLTIVALGFGILLFSAFIWYFIAPLFRTNLNRDATDAEAGTPDIDNTAVSLALLGYDSTTGLSHHNGTGLRGRYPATPGSYSMFSLEDAKSERYGNQPCLSSTALPILPYHYEGYPAFWSTPPPAYSFTPWAAVSVPRPVHITPGASAEMMSFLMTGLANPVDDRTFGDSRIRSDWKRRSLSYPDTTIDADDFSRVLRRNLSDPGRYTIRYTISPSSSDSQITLRGAILAPDGLSSTELHEPHHGSDDNKTLPTHNLPHEPIFLSDSMMTIRPCTALYAPHGYVPIGVGSQKEILLGTPDHGSSQSGLRELGDGEIEIEGGTRGPKDL